MKKGSFWIGLLKSKKNNRVFTADYQRKNNPVVLMTPYGLFSNPPTGTPVGISADQCNEESLYAVPFEADTGKLEDLGSGEIAIGSPAQSPRVYFESEKIVFDDGKNKGEDFAVRFNELKTGFDQLRSDFNAFLTHVHGGSGTPPTPPPTPSTATIDNAKIDDIEMPKK